MSKDVLCFVAGQSGGHIIPCLTMARQAKLKNPQIAIVFFSTDSLLDTAIIRDNSVVDTHITLPLKTVSKQKWYMFPIMCWLMVYALCKSLYYLHKFKPSTVITTGGLIAIPLCLAAKIMRIPTAVYELNVQPGRAIACIAPYVDRVYVCFNKTAELISGRLCTKADYPIRFCESDKYAKQDITQIGLDPNKKTIFVLGGSQGSQFINSAITHLVRTDNLLASKINIIHQTGKGIARNVQEVYTQYGVKSHVFNYENDVSAYYNLADMVISRAGSGALFELLYFKKNSLIIPLETQRDSHQYANACEMAAQYSHLFTVLRQCTIQRDNTILSRIIARTINVN